MILNLIRKGMTEQDFEAALKAKVASPFQTISQTQDINLIKRNLTHMASNLRTLQQQLLGPSKSIYDALNESKN